MQWLLDNAFLIGVLLVCLGMHLFGHGHHRHEPHGKSRQERDEERRN